MSSEAFLKSNLMHMQVNIITWRSLLWHKGHYYEVQVIIMTCRSLFRIIRGVLKNNNPFKTMNMCINSFESIVLKERKYEYMNMCPSINHHWITSDIKICRN